MASTNQSSSDYPCGALRMSTEYNEDSSCWINQVGSRLRVLKPSWKRVFSRLPETSQARRDASLRDSGAVVQPYNKSDIVAAEEKEKSVLYLAYGSNLCNETFRDKRGIRPLSQINVVVPSLRLTFDLPGIPYIEPCFANSAARDPDSASDPAQEGKDYHKDRWKKGMVGCVYEVTPSDYAHIIATEGGGASYHDILVDCYPLPDSDTVPSSPSEQPFKAHTLFAPRSDSTTRSSISRPDPSYAQPSARYLKLITDGATELSLPREYQDYLQDIRTYTITTRRQSMGKTLFESIWMPFFALLLALNGRFQDKDGKTPKWLATLVGMLFAGMWMSYDGVFKNSFGDGERTIGDDAAEDLEPHNDTGSSIGKFVGERRGGSRSNEIEPV